MESARPAAQAPAGGSFAPLAQGTFAVLWAATVLGNVGSFMRDVASAWLATDLSSSPAAVAMIQAAGTLPVFLLAIPAGVLSDILDRRKFLIAIQVGLGLVSSALALLAWRHALTIEILVAMAFAGGVGAAMMGPTWQSIVPELVPGSQLKSAVALNALGVNIARAIGPAAGGLLLAAFGAAFTYGADAISYVFVIAALLWWRPPAKAHDPLREHFLGAFRAGLRFTRAHSKLHVVLARAAVHFAFGSSVWALLPLVARQLLHGGASLYGVLLGAVGLGAILGALTLPRLQRRLDSDGIVLLSALVTAAVMAALAVAPPVWAALVLLLLLGAAWIAALTTLGGTAQAILPNWVRGRALAVYQMVFNGALAGGSLVWGFVAQALGTPLALLIAAAGLGLAGLALHRMRLPRGEEDLAPARHWPEPHRADEIAHDRGPVEENTACAALTEVPHMDRYLSIEAFVRVADTLSFAEAARQLGVTNSVVSHRVQQLEKYINAPLFHRSTRHVRLSEVGSAYYRKCSELVAELSDLTDQMRDLRASPAGKLRIQVLPGFALRHFAKLLAAFCERYPDIEIEVFVSDCVNDPIEEGFDITFQIFPAQNDSLIERRLFTLRRLFCASPEYLERHGVPQTPADLRAARLALYSAYPTRNKWVFSRGTETVEIELLPAMRTNSVHLLRDYALTGACIVCVPSLVASEELLDGRLVPVLQEYALTPFPFSAVYPATQRQALKVRVLVDFLAEQLAGEPPWDVPLIERGWLSPA